MRFGFVLCGAVALGLGGCIGTEVRNDSARMTGRQASAFCRDLAARSGTPQDDDCHRALSGGLLRSAQMDAPRPSYAAGRDDVALAGTSRDRRDTLIRCVERTVDGAPVTTCR